MQSVLKCLVAYPVILMNDISKINKLELLRLCYINRMLYFQNSSILELK